MIKALNIFALLLCSFIFPSGCSFKTQGYADTGGVTRPVEAPKDKTRGEIQAFGGVTTPNGYWVWSYTTIERIAELPGQPKTIPYFYAGNLSSEQSAGSRWFSATWGTEERDRQRQGLPKERFPIYPPLVPPGVYRLTSRVAYIGLNSTTPFQGEPQSTTIVVEAGESTVLAYHTEVDDTTRPITAKVSVKQLGHEEAIALMRRNRTLTISKDFHAAEPLPEDSPLWKLGPKHAMPPFVPDPTDLPSILK